MPSAPLSYAQVHVQYTLPPILLLLLFSRPFLVATEVNKIALLSVIAVIYTTPWDNFIISRGAWTYPKDRVMGVIGYVPIEEYAFFIIQTLLTGLITVLIQRWDLPILHLKPPTLLSRYPPLILFLLQFALGITMLTTAAFEPLGWSQDQCFYVGALISWTAPVLRPPMVGCRRLHFCKKHLNRTLRVWEISRTRTLNIMVTQHLPFEEALFFFLVNCMIVFGLMAIDQTLRLHPPAAVNWLDKPSAWRTIFTAVITQGSVPSSHVQDATSATKLLQKGSTTFYLASKLLPIPVAEDIQALYAFCRIADDLIDHTMVPILPTALSALQNFITSVYTSQQSIEESIKAITDTTLLIRQHDSKPSHPKPPIQTLTGSLYHFARRIPPRVPERVLRELLSAFEWDAKKQGTSTEWFEDEEELIEYCERVAGSVGKPALVCARSMGVALQLVNIARDLAADVEGLRRLYVPANWIQEIEKLEGEKGLKERILKNPWKESRVLALCGKRVIKISGEFEGTAREVGIKGLTRALRDPVRAAMDMYGEIGKRVGRRCDEILARRVGVYPRRVVVGRWGKLRILVRDVFLP
ncbi:Squalene/phytoene synthase-domain-containing protein [Chytridium lagenaria]|nr:Squalene/phytoene synthase-domain-containing protein [Chytridium lagenaria]